MQNNPYIGPRPFERSDRDRFFGRTRETRDLLSLIIAERVVLFYAQSGAGKTSLLNTQIIPALEGEGFKVLPVARVGSDVPRGIQAAAVKNIFTFSALLSLAGQAANPQELLDQSLSTFLQRGADDDTPPIVIFDQFEEILATHRERWQEARGFIEQLRDALRAVPKLGAVLAMREDYVAGLDPYAVLLPRRLKARFRMELLGYDGALEAVKKPAQDAAFGFGTGVAERLVDDLRRIQRAADRSLPDEVYGPYVEPVQLQVVCSRLWENLPDRDERVITWADIDQFGNIDRALTDFYETALTNTVHETGVSERQLRRWFEQELITPMKTRGLAWRSEHDTNGLPNEAVDVLEQQHLIRAEVRAGAHWYELAHDRLVDPIVASNAAWEQARMTPLRATAQNWKQSTNADLLYGGRALFEAQQWTASHPNEVEDYEREFLDASLQAQRTRKRNRIVRLSAIAALSAGLVMMGVLAIVALRSRDEAEQQREIAYDAQATAVAGQQEADQQRQIAVTAEAQAMTQQQEAARQAREARRALSSQLGVQANVERSKLPQRSLLLGVEALSTTLRTGEPRVAVAEEAVRQALSETGGRSLSGHEAAITAVALNHDNHWLVTADKGNVARLWNFTTITDTTAPSHILPGHGIPVGISPDHRWLVTADNGNVRLWDLSSADPVANPISLPGSASGIDTAAFSQDNRWLITIDQYESANLWDLAAIAPDRSATPIVLQVHESKSHDTGTDFIATTLDDRWLVTVDRYSFARVWDVSTSELAPLPAILQTPGITITTVALSPDKHWLVTGGFNEDRHNLRSGTPAYLWDLTASNPILTRRELQGFQGPVFAVAFSPDHHWMYTASADFGNSPNDLTVRLWDLAAANPAADPIPLSDLSVGPDGFQVSPDNRWVAVAGEQEVRLLDLSMSQPLSISLLGAISPATFSGNSHWLATSGSDNSARIWDLTTYNPAATPIVLPRGHEGSITAIAFSSDDHWLVTGSDDKTARVWDLNAPGPVEPPSISLSVPASPVKPAPIGISADKRWLVIGGNDGSARLLDLSGSEPVLTRTMPGNVMRQPVLAVAISRDNHWLAVGNYDDTVRVIDLASSSLDATKVISQTWRDGGAHVGTVALSPNNHWLVTANWNGVAHLWDLMASDPRPIPRVSLEGQPGEEKNIAISDDNRWLVIASESNAYLWDLNTIETVTQPLTLPDARTPVVISSDSHWLATRSGDGIAQLWDLTAPTPTAKSIALPARNTAALFISPDSRVLITGDSDGLPRLWDLTAPDPAVVSRTLTSSAGLTLHDAAIAISSDGRWLIIAGDGDNSTYLWDLTLPTAKPVGLPGRARMVDFTADNHRLITTDGQTTRLWKLRLDELINLACQTAGRNLTRNEWEQYFPDESHRKTCEQWPLEPVATPAP